MEFLRNNTGFYRQPEYEPKKGGKLGVGGSSLDFL